ncbi:MAG: cytidylate kinase-like family protein [Bacteroidales bacterium]|nr:cytidylate kinase-like family protein [Bacteroides sp.]MCM1198208.1 cytidylate kinase-like family protein [Clostridium sp.]MCM1501554.1 cytidylate kinase-like family protein [Bacteroidales bacterium]
MEHTVINVGRQFGSGGKAVALEIGKKLGVNVYDNELIIKAAEKSGFSPELFTRNDERRNFFGFPLPSNGFHLSDNFIDGGALFKIQSKVIEDIAETESAVIIGRCSDYILRDREKTLDVFITAPMSYRIRRVSKRMDITPEKAAEIINRQDRKRETYYNYFTFGNWGVASNYDLCIDSSILGIEGTADHIIGFARKAGIL